MAGSRAISVKGMVTSASLVDECECWVPEHMGECPRALGLSVSLETLRGIYGCGVSGRRLSGTSATAKISAGSDGQTRCMGGGFTWLYACARNGVRSV